MQLNVLMQNCGERRNNSIFCSEIYKKCDQVSALIQSWMFPKSLGGLFGILNVCHEMSGIDLEKILYKVIPLQTLSHLGYDFYIRANMQGQG